MLEELFRGDFNFGGDFARREGQLNYLLVKGAVARRDSRAMMKYLADLVGNLIEVTQNREEVCISAGNGYLSMAKWFEEVPQGKGRTFARESLEYSIRFYNLSGKNPGYEGLTEREIDDYISNPRSLVSLKQFNTRLRRESHEKMKKEGSKKKNSQSQ